MKAYRVEGSNDRRLLIVGLSGDDMLRLVDNGVPVIPATDSGLEYDLAVVGNATEADLEDRVDQVVCVLLGCGDHN